MRVRTAKQRAQRIDLNYFKQTHGLKRWRVLLSLALPLAVLLWVSVYAIAGGRGPYSAGPVSSAHAFAEQRCEACHTGSTEPRTPRDPRPMFRAHTTDAACLSCHDAPKHAASQTPEPACTTCHQEHRGRVQIAKTDDRFCLDCHGDLKVTPGPPKIAAVPGGFPDGHPEFAALGPGAADPAKLRFNHAVHLKDSLRGLQGSQKLECASCHKPEALRADSGQVGRIGVFGRGPATTGLMAPVSYDENCASCHPLFFDERIEQAAPHAKPETVRGFVQQALAVYIREHPGDVAKPDTAFRRVPLNFPRPPEPAAKNAQEWVARRAAADERLLWNKTCAECHESASPSPTSAGYPAHLPTSVTKRWMPRATFDHTPHRMVTCVSCHQAGASSKTADVLLPDRSVCATCHAPAKKTESRCFECHQYHDWARSHPITPPYSLTDFK